MTKNQRPRANLRAIFKKIGKFRIGKQVSDDSFHRSRETSVGADSPDGAPAHRTSHHSQKNADINGTQSINSSQAFIAAAPPHRRCNHPACLLCKHRPRRAFVWMVPTVVPGAADHLGSRLGVILIVRDLKLEVSTSLEESRIATIAVLSLIGKALQERGVVGLVGGINISPNRFTLDKSGCGSNYFPAQQTIWALARKDEIRDVEGWLVRYFPDFVTCPYSVVITELDRACPSHAQGLNREAFRKDGMPSGENRPKSLAPGDQELARDQFAGPRLTLESDGGRTLLLSVTATTDNRK